MKTAGIVIGLVVFLWFKRLLIDMEEQQRDTEFDGFY